MVDDPDDVAALARTASALADAISAALPGWVERSVVAMLESAGIEPDAATVTATDDAGRAAVDQIVPRLRALLATDVDQQRSNPLSIVREAVVFPTAVLRAAGVPPVVRDEFAVRAFPDDDYGLAPATWADLGPDVPEPGIVWGAAKAHIVLSRRRAEGRR